MKKKNITTFREAEDYINDTPRFTSKNTMEDTREFLHRLGDPDQRMRIIHVAGTNGKGSVCAYLCSILEAAGYRAALFTSPHLVCIRERFAVDGEMITEEEFLEAFLHIYNMLDWDSLEREEGAYHPTYFEYLFFIAMLVFGEKKPDFCILETGVGGRLDATNSVSHKELCIITHIGLDHVEYLGDTVEKIAFEKAGIMQEGVPAVFWDTCPETTAVFRERAEKLGISAYSVSEKDYSFLNFKRKTIDFCVDSRYYGKSTFHGRSMPCGEAPLHGENTSNGEAPLYEGSISQGEGPFREESEFHRYISLTLHTIAAYQRENCTLAVRGIEVLDEGKTITAQQIQAGVSRCFWAGRMEEVLPEVYVDGAHNEDGIRAFLETVEADGHEGARTLLFSVVKDKDYRHMAEKLQGSGLFGRVAVAHMHGCRALDGESLKGLFTESAGCVPEIYDNVEDAFLALLQRQQAKERIYIAGSLYLVGEIKELLEHDQFRRRIEKISSQP